MLAGVKVENPVQIFGQGSEEKNTQKEQKKSEKERKTNVQIAKMANVSDETIRKVEKIEAKAAPEVKEALRSGEISINAAYEGVKAGATGDAHAKKLLTKTNKFAALINGKSQHSTGCREKKLDKT